MRASGDSVMPARRPHTLRASDVARSRVGRRALHVAIGAAALATGCNSLFDIHAGRLAGTPGVGVVGVDCTPSTTRLAPADGLIADFMGPGDGIEIGGEIVRYGDKPNGIDGPGSPSYTTTGGALEIMENAPPGPAPRYLGVIISFDGCVDASAFTGVQFSISDTSLGGCTMQYDTGDVVHQSATTGLPYATGAPSAYQPQAMVIPEPTPATLMMPFVGGPSGGNPATPVDTTKLTFVAWQFTVAAAGGALNCVADVTIDDVKFY
jgi:hypothetical protein